MSHDSDRSPDLPETAPAPTYAPVAMAMGVTLAAWGILTHWLMSVPGVCLIVWALWNWISEICNDWGSQDD